MKKNDFWQRLLIIFLPIGMLFCMGRAMFWRGDFWCFLGCASIALISFLTGAILIYYNPQIIEPIETFVVSIWSAVKILFT